jgi:hypothetical protein
MRKIILLLLIGLTIIPMVSYANTWAENSNTQDLTGMQNTIYEKVKNSLEPEIKEELKNSKEDLREVFDDYLVLMQEVKTDFKWYLAIIIWIIAILWTVLRFYIQKVTSTLVENRVQNNIKPILDNKITEYDKKIDEDLQRVGSEVKEKSIIVLPLDPDWLAEITIRNQWFFNTTKLNTLSLWIESDTIVVDIQNLDMSVEENKSQLSVILEEVKTNYANTPLLIFYKGQQLSRTDFHFPDLTTFSNNQLSLVSNLYDCLRYQKDIWNAPMWI